MGKLQIFSLASIRTVVVMLLSVICLVTPLAYSLDAESETDVDPSPLDGNLDGDGLGGVGTWQGYDCCSFDYCDCADGCDRNYDEDYAFGDGLCDDDLSCELITGAMLGGGGLGGGGLGGDPDEQDDGCPCSGSPACGCSCDGNTGGGLGGGLGGGGCNCACSDCPGNSGGGGASPGNEIVDSWIPVDAVNIFYLSETDDPAGLTLRLPEYATAYWSNTTTWDNGYLECAVDWLFEDFVKSVAGPGLYTIYGYIEVPDGFAVWRPGIDDQVYCIVFIGDIPQDQKLEIYRVGNPRFNADVLKFALGGDPRDLDLPLYTTAKWDNPPHYTLEGEIELFINWRYDEFVDSLTGIGRYEITGYVEAPEGFYLRSWSDGEIVGQDLEVLVDVYDPDNIETAERVEIDVYGLFNREIPLGLSYDEIVDEFMIPGFGGWIIPGHTTVDVYTESGLELRGRIIDVDYTRVNTAVPGAYYPFLIELPPGVEYGGESAVWEIPGAEAYVVDYGEPAEGELYLRYEPGEPAFQISTFWSKAVVLPRLWASLDGGDTWLRVYDNCCSEPAWVCQQAGQCVTGDLGREMIMYHSFSPNQDGTMALELHLRDLEDGQVYEFEIRYLNGGVSLDGIRVDLTDGTPKCEGIGGDRNRGDRREQELPPVGGGTPNDPPPEDPGSGSGSSSGNNPERPGTHPPMPGLSDAAGGETMPPSDGTDALPGQGIPAAEHTPQQNNSAGAPAATPDGIQAAPLIIGAADNARANDAAVPLEHQQELLPESVEQLNAELIGDPDIRTSAPQQHNPPEPLLVSGADPALFDTSSNSNTFWIVAASVLFGLGAVGIFLGITRRVRR